MTDLQRLRARLVAIRAGLLGIAALSSDAAIEAAALRTVCDDALADLSAIEAQRAQRGPALERLGDAGTVGLLVDGPGPNDEIH